MHRSTPARLAVAVEYPDSDGRPGAEGDFQCKPTARAATTRQAYFHPTGPACVAGSLFVYYKGATARHVAEEAAARRVAETRVAEREARPGRAG